MGLKVTLDSHSTNAINVTFSYENRNNDLTNKKSIDSIEIQDSEKISHIVRFKNPLETYEFKQTQDPLYIFEIPCIFKRKNKNNIFFSAPL